MTALLLLYLISCVAPVSADILAVYSKTSAGWPKDRVTLTFVNSQTLTELRTVELGTARDHNEFFGLGGPEGKYFYSVVPNAGELGAELLVFSTEALEEIARLPLGEVSALQINQGLGFVRIAADGKQLVILRKTNRKWYLDVYDRLTHEKLATTELPKKLSDGILLPNGSYAAVTPTRNKKRELRLVDAANGQVVASHEFPRRTELRLEYTERSAELMVFATRRVAIERRLGSHELIYGDVVYLHRVDIKTGQKTDGQKLGYEPTPIFRAENNRYGYFGTRGSLEDEGLVLWRVEGSQVEKVVETDYLVSPHFALVSEAANRAVFFHKEHAIFVNLKTSAIEAEDQINLYPTTGSLNSSGTLAYLKQEMTSKVGVLDLRRDRAAEVTSAGSAVKTLGYATATLAAAVWVASSLGSPFLPWVHPPPPSTSMLLDAQEQYLYVINDQTDDITVLNAETLKRESLLRVSNSLFMAHQRNGDFIWAFGQDEIALIDPGKNEIVMRRSKGVFAGAKLELGRVYFADESGLNVIDTSTGKVTTTVETLPNAYLVVHALQTSAGEN